jgi:hypothetical protein
MRCWEVMLLKYGSREVKAEYELDVVLFRIAPAPPENATCMSTPPKTFNKYHGTYLYHLSHCLGFPYPDIASTTPP